MHDLRRTCRSEMSRLGVDNLTVELVIGHMKQGMLLVYDQHDWMEERTTALEKWGEHVVALQWINPRNLSNNKDCTNGT